MSSKKKVLFLFPGPIYRPDLPDFRERFRMLSGNFEGEIYSWSCDPGFRGYQIGSFVYRGLVDRSKGLIKKWNLLKHIISNARRYQEYGKVDAVVCYEPMFTGVIGVILKLVFHCTLVVEINSEYYAGATAAFYGKGMIPDIREIVLKALSNISLFYADAIKALTPNIEKKLPQRFRNKKVFIFHDFVPTHLFSASPAGDSGKFILFAGYPFKLKGVDCLIRAFRRISGDHPDFRLLLIGHKLEEEARKAFDPMPGRINFMRGVGYDVIFDYFRKCYCFVLPSLTEGLGRVLIEAMACGKPVIGTRAGGIPDLIDDGVNGFLVDVGDDDGLAEKLHLLLSNERLAADMGNNGRRMVEERFSSGLYIEFFCKMIQKAMAGNDAGKENSGCCHRAFR
ncbi:MAG: glycosyltransferase family 4 protein [Candidatus Omnitrophota bacterium]